MPLGRQVIEAMRPERFDVICTGEPLWRSSVPFLGDAQRARSPTLVNVARLLTARGLHVGWAAVLEDDRRGRALLAEVDAMGVKSAVRLAPVGTDLVVVDASGGWSGRVSDGGKAAQPEIPPSWSSEVVLLSGLKPVTSRLAAFCAAARRARRSGTVVVLDLVGSLRDWNGYDPRVISMVLREADVVRCSLFDLAVIGTDPKAVRRAMKSNATLVLDDDGGATATGMFGDVRVESSRESSGATVLAESYTAAICVEYARPRRVGETPDGRWHRVLRDEARRLTAAIPITRPSGGRARF
jgi:fructokinase/2-dehydro-3-deoxygluconokinase